MKLLAIFGMVLLLSSMVMVGQGSYGLETSFGGANKGVRYGELSYHGPNSARLSINPLKSTSRVIIGLEDPLPMDHVEDCCMQVFPMAGVGYIEMRLFLDVNGDGKYTDKKAAGDNWIKARILYDFNSSESEWSDLSIFDQRFVYEDRNGDEIGDFAECRDHFAGVGIIKIYITLSRKSKTDSGSCLIDYVKINGMVASFEPNEGPHEKKGKPSRISQGSKITYTITYGNDFNNTTLTNLVIVEDYDPRMTLLSAYPPPDPGTNNVWTIGNVSPGHYGQIVLVMKMEKQNFVAEVEGRVYGTGFVSVRRRFTTDRSPHLIINQVRISCDQREWWGRVETPVKLIVGTTLSFSEHGSGSYESEEALSYRTTRMKMERGFEALQAPSVLNLSFGRVLGYNSSWYASHDCMDEKRGSIIRERYLYADRLNCTGAAEVRSTRLKLDSESNFSGMAIYEIESHTDDRDAVLASVFEGSYSLKSGSEVYK